MDEQYIWICGREASIGGYNDKRDCANYIPMKCRQCHQEYGLCDLQLSENGETYLPCDARRYELKEVEGD